MNKINIAMSRFNVQVRNYNYRKVVVTIFLLVVAICTAHGQLYINSNFENGSPINWHCSGNDTVFIDLIYDYERLTGNRTVGHWYFQLLDADQDSVAIVFSNFFTIRNGKQVSTLASKYGKPVCYFSFDNKNWTPVSGTVNDQNQLIVFIPARGTSCYIASLPPYTLNDYSDLIGSVASNPLVKIDTIGQTSGNKPLEIIRIGNPDATNSVFIRARAHSFECGGSWVVEGLINKLLLPGSERIRSEVCFYILAMANKDMVSRGMSRYNAPGFDLNRNLDSPANRTNVPENYAMEKWLTDFINSGKKIDLALDFHNDRWGNVHLAETDAEAGYYKKMRSFCDLVSKHTWYQANYVVPKNSSGTFANGLFNRFGIDAAIVELNLEWIGNLNRHPTSGDWNLLGEQLPGVFMDFFGKN